MCGSTMFGVIVKPILRKKIGELNVLTVPASADQKATELWLVEDMDEWRMTALRAACPREIAGAGQAGKKVNTIDVARPSN